MASRYAWVITQELDNPYDEDTELELPIRVGVAGPSTVTDEDVRHALNEGGFLRLLDDDNPYYIGRCRSIDGRGSEEMIGPLDDHGRADLGATEIQYRANGDWQAL